MRTLSITESRQIVGGVTYAEDVTATMTTLALGTLLYNWGTKIADAFNGFAGLGPKATTHEGKILGEALHCIGALTPIIIGATILYQHPELYDLATKRLGAYF